MMSSNHLSEKEAHEKVIIEIDQSVTGLLKCTKDLLEALTNWSIQSDNKENIYEQHGFLQSHFDKVCDAFQAANLSMEDLNHIPHDLRQCLDAALSQDPSVLEQHLPSIRDTILQLLHGLKRKQALLQEKSTTATTAQSFTTDTTATDLNLKNNMTTSTSSSSELDMMDPNTQQAFTQLRDDGDLADRSSIRRSSTMETVNHINHSQLSTTVDLSTIKSTPVTTNTTIQLPSRRRRRLLSSPSYPNLAKPPTPSPPPRRISTTTPSSPAESTTIPSATTRNNNTGTSSLILFLRWRNRVKRVVVEKPFDNLDQVMNLFCRTFKHGSDGTTTDIPTNGSKISVLDNDTNIMFELDDITLIQSNSLLSLDDVVTKDKELVVMIEQIFKTQFDQWTASLTSTTSNNGLDLSNTMIAADDISDNARLTQQQQILVHQIRNNFDVLQKAIEEQQQNSEKLMTQLVDYQQQERDKKDQGNHQLQQNLQDMGQALTTRLETLQDTIDDMKQDVTQRRCRPSPNQLEDCHKESDAVQGMIRSLGDYLSQSKPTWKKTWEEQLQRIVGEQQCVKEYEHLVLDFEEDHSAIQTVLQHLTQVSELQKRQPHASTKPPSVMVNLGGGGDDQVGGRQGMGHVLQQLQTIDVDHQKRLDALEHAEKRRARDMANRIDDFEKELITFVDTNKLKKTGGPEQLERQQQEKTKQLLMDLYEKNKDT